MEQNEVLQPHQDDITRQARERDAYYYSKRMERYARQTRTATVWIAWIVGVFAALSVIGGIATYVAVSHADTGVSSSCYSQGGTDVSC